MTPTLLQKLIPSLVLTPALGAAILLGLPSPSEKTVSRWTRATLVATFLLGLLSIAIQFLVLPEPIRVSLGSLYETHDYSFPLAFILDTHSAVYLLLTSILTLVTAKYSRYYLHRENGYRRYFALILLMVTGSNLVAVAGTLDLLFAGWELIGLSSFLLIAFYWGRHQPARNSFLAFTVYRICDVGLLAATMLGHVLWTEGDRLMDMNLAPGWTHAVSHPQMAWLIPFIACLIVFASLGKSAQFPFFNWLPRAMEGPTPSSAIFYGALSIHAGVFLLMRTEPLWTPYPWIRATVIGIGATSAILATILGRTLSNIKGQLAYASIAQVGLMFIEIALGWHTLAFTHLVLNSFLRAYQILVSPSIVAHALRLMESPEGASELTHRLLHWPMKLSPRFERFVYRLCLSEFYLWPSRAFVLKFGWTRRLPALGWTHGVLATAFIFVAFWVESSVRSLPAWSEAHPWAAAFACVITLVTALLAQSSRQSSKQAWFRIAMVLILGLSAIFILDPREAGHVVWPFFGMSSFAWILGLISLARLGDVSLRHFHGRMGSLPGSSYLLLTSLLILAGMPLSPSFITEDLLLHWIFERSVFATILLALSLMLTGIAVARVYSRVCMGPSWGNPEET